jgi:hypothetical protein
VKKPFGRTLINAFIVAGCVVVGGFFGFWGVVLLGNVILGHPIGLGLGLLAAFVGGSAGVVWGIDLGTWIVKRRKS